MRFPNFSQKTHQTKIIKKENRNNQCLICQNGIKSASFSTEPLNQRDTAVSELTSFGGNYVHCTLAVYTLLTLL